MSRDFGIQEEFRLFLGNKNRAQGVHDFYFYLLVTDLSKMRSVKGFTTCPK